MLPYSTLGVTDQLDIYKLADLPISLSPTLQLRVALRLRNFLAISQCPSLGNGAQCPHRTCTLVASWEPFSYAHSQASSALPSKTRQISLFLTIAASITCTPASFVMRHAHAMRMSIKSASGRPKRPLLFRTRSLRTQSYSRRGDVP